VEKKMVIAKLLPYGSCPKEIINAKKLWADPVALFTAPQQKYFI